MTKRIIVSSLFVIFIACFLFFFKLDNISFCFNFENCGIEGLSASYESLRDSLEDYSIKCGKNDFENEILYDGARAYCLSDSLFLKYKYDKVWNVKYDGNGKISLKRAALKNGYSFNVNKLFNLIYVVEKNEYSFKIKDKEVKNLKNPFEPLEMQVYADSMNSDGDMFEVLIPKSYSVRKSGIIMGEIVCYTFLDSLQKPFMYLTLGIGNPEVNHLGYQANQNVLDSFILLEPVYRSYFDNDTLKIKKISNVFDIYFSSRYIKAPKRKSFSYKNPETKRYEHKYQNTGDSIIWYDMDRLHFEYDSTKVDASMCKKIISTLRYRKPQKAE